MQRGLRIAVAFTVITFVLHWMWEIAHGPAYVETAIPLEQRIWHCLPMALVDTAWSGGIIALTLVMTRARALGIAAVAGAATAVLLERFALDTGRWMYNQMMPIVPVVNVGLWPVLQMAVIPPVALVIARACTQARAGGNVRGGGGLLARDVVWFLAFSHGWTWLFWALAGLSGESIWNPPSVVLFYTGGAGVFIGGVVMSWIVCGRSGIRDLAWRAVDPTRISSGWWVTIVLFFPALALAAAAVSGLSGASAEPIDLEDARDRLIEPARFLAFVAFILLIGPLPEEVGWRGYLLDRLQLRAKAVTASLALAVIWWSWHLPLFFLPGYVDAFDNPPSLLHLLSGIVPAAVLYTWVYNNTNRSILAVILFHFMQNLTGELFGPSPAVRSIETLLVLAAAVAVIYRWGPATMRGNRPTPLPCDSRIR